MKISTGKIFIVALILVVTALVAKTSGQQGLADAYMTNGITLILLCMFSD